MSGFLGIASKTDCVADLFYRTDYHSHLGTYALATVGRMNDLEALHEDPA
jgi:hypothetical protein